MKLYAEIKYLCKVATAGSQEARKLERVKKLFAEAYRNVEQTQKNTADSGVKYSIDERFESLIDNWDGETVGFSFVVGETSAALQEAGVPKKQIRWDASKIKTLLGKHIGMTLETVKQIPELMERPIVVIDSKKGSNSKIVMGDLYDEHGHIVTAVVLLTPTSKKGNVLEVLKISSAEGRSHINSLFVYEDGTPVAVRYVDKKRIQSWLNVNRLQLPLHNLDLDSNIIIDGSETNVKAQFSLSDSNGNELSPAVQNRFAKSRVVDDDGNLKVVYHGTPNGEFTIFDKTKGSVEGDFGSGFYFTDNADDVSRNYEGGGPDFENKVARRAEQIEQEEDIEYAEAVARARKELYVGSNKFEVYLNIENPAIVGETNLLDPESYYEQYDREDYDSEKDWEGDVEQLIADEIENIIWEVEKNVDVDNTDGLAKVLWNAVIEGGIDIEQLKANINNLYLEDSNGNLVGNEVTRQIIESLGYDGIIDNTVPSKFNMGLSEDTTHYIVFNPNQIKNVSNQNPTDNPDINLSLSNEGDIAPVGKFLGKDMALEGVPVAENARMESAPTVDDIAPVAQETDSPEGRLYRAEQNAEGVGIKSQLRNNSVFHLPEMKNEAESTPAGESPKNGSLATPKDSASKYYIRGRAVCQRRHCTIAA